MGKYTKIIDLDVALHGTATPITEGVYDTPEQTWRGLLDEVKAQRTVIDRQQEDLDAAYGIVIDQDARITDLDSALGTKERRLAAQAEQIREHAAYRLKIERLVKDLRAQIDGKDEELRTVVDREHKIHNEAAAGMIQRIKDLDELLRRAALNEGVWTKKAAKQELVIKQLKEEVVVLERAVNDAAANEGGLYQQVVDLTSTNQRIQEERRKQAPEPAAEAGARSGASAAADFASAMASGIRRIREAIEDTDDKGYIEFLEEKIKQKDRRIENMGGELETLYDSKFDSLDEVSAAKQVKELSEVLIHEFGNFFDRSEGAVDMAIRLLRGLKKP